MRQQTGFLNNRRYVLTGILVLWAAFLAGAAWDVASDTWGPDDEAAYRVLVQRLGESNYTDLNEFLRDPAKNPLYEPRDSVASYDADCADLPYILRAYATWKRQRPFSFVTAVAPPGNKGDPRFSPGNTPTKNRDQQDYATPEELLQALPLVSTGWFRMPPGEEKNDTYPVRIGTDTILPGTLYYDPGGHVAIVYKVSPEGRVFLFDGHPDQTISRTQFGPKFDVGPKETGGGFRRWRPLRPGKEGENKKTGKPGSPERTPNQDLPDYSADDQYREEFPLPRGNRGTYHEYVRSTLSRVGPRVSPLKEFKQELLDLHKDLHYRQLAVEMAQKAGLPEKKHPGVLPSNIYQTDGEWEVFSTPSRDARLKKAFAAFKKKTEQIMEMAERGDPDLDYDKSPTELARELLEEYRKTAGRLKTHYRNSKGEVVELSLDDSARRLFNFSFDPYHAPELRWGAQGKERQTAPPDQAKEDMYTAQNRLRNRIDRTSTGETPLNAGPDQPPDLRVDGALEAMARRPLDPEYRNWLSKSIQGTLMTWGMAGSKKEAEETEDSALAAGLPLLMFLILGLAGVPGFRRTGEDGLRSAAKSLGISEKKLKDITRQLAGKVAERKMGEALDMARTVLNRLTGRRPASLLENTDQAPGKPLAEPPGASRAVAAPDDMNLPPETSPDAPPIGVPPLPLSQTAKKEKKGKPEKTENPEKSEKESKRQRMKVQVHVNMQRLINAGYSLQDVKASFENQSTGLIKEPMQESEKGFTVFLKVNSREMHRLQALKNMNIISQVRAASVPLANVAVMTIEPLSDTMGQLKAARRIS